MAGTTSTARRYASILETIGNTPVVRINRLAPAGVNLYAKVEAFNPLGSVKDRLALGAGHLAWQVATIDIDDPESCLRTFRSNRDYGFILFAGLLADCLARAA